MASSELAVAPRRVSDSFSANQDVDARIDQDGFSCPTQVHIAWCQLVRLSHMFTELAPPACPEKTLKRYQHYALLNM